VGEQGRRDAIARSMGCYAVAFFCDIVQARRVDASVPVGLTEEWGTCAVINVPTITARGTEQRLWISHCLRAPTRGIAMLVASGNTCSAV